ITAVTTAPGSRSAARTRARPRTRRRRWTYGDSCHEPRGTPVSADGRPMTAAFYVFAAVAIAATILTITRLDAMHALLYLIVSLLAVAAVFYVLGAPFAELLEVIVYAGAIMVLFVFVVMMLNLGDITLAEERRWLWPQLWLGPSILSAILLVEMLF